MTVRINESKWFRLDDPVAVLPPPPPCRSLPPASLQAKRSAGKTKLAEEGHCRMCLRDAAVRQLTRHHLVKREWFAGQSPRIDALRNCDAVIVPLCRPCHDAVESDLSARRMLRRTLTQGEIAFCIALRGKEWFDDRYPVR